MVHLSTILEYQNFVVRNEMLYVYLVKILYFVVVFENSSCCIEINILLSVEFNPHDLPYIFTKYLAFFNNYFSWYARWLKVRAQLELCKDYQVYNVQFEINLKKFKSWLDVLTVWYVCKESQRSHSSFGFELFLVHFCCQLMNIFLTQLWTGEYVQKSFFWPNGFFVKYMPLIGSNLKY